MAARNRGFTTAAVLTLALGTGAATATFSVVDAIVFRPLPYADADRLVKIWGSTAAEPIDNMSLADLNDISERSGVFEQVAGDDGTGFKVEYGGVVPLRARRARHGAVALHTRCPSRARTRIPAEEFQPGRDDVLILTDAYWRRRFARGCRRRWANAQCRRREAARFSVSFLPTCCATARIFSNPWLRQPIRPDAIIAISTCSPGCGRG